MPLKYGIYEEDMTVPQDDTATTENKLVTSTGAGLGAVEVRFEVTDAITIAATKTLTFTLKTDDASGTATTHSTITFGPDTYAVGYDRALFVLPSDSTYKSYVQVTSTDDAVDGTITIYQNYLPK